MSEDYKTLLQDKLQDPDVFGWWANVTRDDRYNLLVLHPGIIIVLDSLSDTVCQEVIEQIRVFEAKEEEERKAIICSERGFILSVGGLSEEDAQKCTDVINEDYKEYFNADSSLSSETAVESTQMVTTEVTGEINGGEEFSTAAGSASDDQAGMGKNLWTGDSLGIFTPHQNSVSDTYPQTISSMSDPSGSNRAPLEWATQPALAAVDLGLREEELIALQVAVEQGNEKEKIEPSAKRTRKAGD